MKKLKFTPLFIFSILFGFILSGSVFASESASHSTENPYHLAILCLGISGMLFAAKVSHLMEKIKLPPVVGELLAGIILGNLSLIGFSFFSDLRQDEVIKFLSELGVILLLFQIGLESNISQLLKVGSTAMLVAFIGATVPFLVGAYVVGPLLIPGEPIATYLFIGASLAATSVGITARIFKDLGKMSTRPAQIVLGAAVIDDILGLILLAVVSSLALEGTVTPISIGFIILKSFLFLVLSIVIGQLVAPYVGKLFSKIHTGIGAKLTLAVGFCLSFAAIAQFIGLEPIIGSFAAGLVLDPVHFKTFREPHLIEEIREKIENSPALVGKFSKILQYHSDKSVEEVVEPLSLFFVPIFFVMTGMSVDLSTLFNPSTILISLAITTVAVLGKIVSSIPVPKGEKLTVGLAMVPRGEVGLIFAAIGSEIGVLSPQLFSVIVLSVLLTTIIGPVLLTMNLKKA